MDDVYHLGDFVFASRKQYNEVIDIIKQLNGRIHFIRGNHCDSTLWEMIDQANLPHVEWIKDYHSTRIDGVKVIMCHYPMAVWDSAHHGSFMLHGHCHGSYIGQGKILDCGIDNHPDRQVFSWNEIKDYMRDRTWNAVDHHEDGGR